MTLHPPRNQSLQESRGGPGHGTLQGSAPPRVEPVTLSQARIARDAYRDYGKGSGHKASLNFGACFAYALAKETGEPLLFKGDDFSSTDIASALDGR